MIQVSYRNQVYEVREGTAIGDFLEASEPAVFRKILLVRMDGRLRELHHSLRTDCRLEGIELTDPIGREAYKRSLGLLFLRAARELLPDPAIHVILRFTHSNAVFYMLERDGKAWPLPRGLVRDIRDRMRQLADQRVVLEKKTLSTYEARQYFADKGMSDKVELLGFRRASTVNLYGLDGFFDYFYGYMVRDTGYLTCFDLEGREGELALILPDRKGPDSVSPLCLVSHLYEVQDQSELWAKKIGINTVGDLNRSLCSGTTDDVLQVAEAFQEGKISEIARRISEKNARFVMIAGPSSSGKTTFSRRLSLQLRAEGHIPHPVSLDNYYKDRSECPLDAEGKLDFEALEALDLDLIREQVKALCEGRRVELPRFNFLTGKREYHGDFLELGEKDILIFEGIHGLSDAIGEGLEEADIFRIYISALTQLNVDEHNSVSTTDGRLIRRIVRDHRTRGTSARETIAMWPSVRRGEDVYIFPNQNNADVIFNSALLYELAILKVYAEPLLFQIREEDPEYLEAKKLLKFLDYFLAMPSENVPRNSILREFIGGSCFDV